tara:strand:- start:6137 stop:7057 length:921 start_codon:yes stop_codon:yes gene_type:complete
VTLSYDQVSAITEKYYVKKLNDNIFDSNPYLRRVKDKSLVMIDGGTSVMVELEYAINGAGGWYSGADTLDTSDTEIITAADYTLKQIYENISIKRSDELKNSGDAQKLSLVKSKIKNAEKSMQDRLGTGVYSDGTVAKSIVGLRDFCAVDQTVGGISQSTYSWWQSNLDSSTTVTSMSALQTQFEAATVDNQAPTVGLTTRAILGYYYSLLQPQQRFTDSDTARGGFSSLMFNGVPIIADSHCPSSHLFFVNEDVVKLYAHKDEWMRFRPFQEPDDQNVRTAKIFSMCAFTSGNNRLLACLSALAS